MKIVELKPEQLPLRIRFVVEGEVREYVLLKTKGNKLLLNKPTGESPSKNS
jgi:hypothetical protein